MEGAAQPVEPRRSSRLAGAEVAPQSWCTPQGRARKGSGAGQVSTAGVAAAGGAAVETGGQGSDVLGVQRVEEGITAEEGRGVGDKGGDGRGVGRGHHEGGGQEEEGIAGGAQLGQ